MDGLSKAEYFGVFVADVFLRRIADHRLWLWNFAFSLRHGDLRSNKFPMVSCAKSNSHRYEADRNSVFEKSALTSQHHIYIAAK